VAGTLQKTAADTGTKRWRRQLTFLKGKLKEFGESTSSAKRRELHLALHPARHTKCRKARHDYEKCVIQLKMNALICTKKKNSFSNSQTT
jgi:hypothetical protein